MWRRCGSGKPVVGNAWQRSVRECPDLTSAGIAGRRASSPREEAAGKHILWGACFTSARGCIVRCPFCCSFRCYLVLTMLSDDFVFSRRLRFAVNPKIASLSPRSCPPYIAGATRRVLPRRVRRRVVRASMGWCDGLLLTHSKHENDAGTNAGTW